MGLSSSQARLLTLTSRQHTVEGEAQRIQANKLRLANDSDKAYMKYLNALDDTMLQTKQRNKNTGADSWISGSLNNLLRYNASDDYTGSVFYVQDLASGQLYMPQAICDNYASAAASGDDTVIMNFIKKCDGSISYKKVDKNEDILRDYQMAVTQGYSTCASEAIVKRYYEEKNKDESIIGDAQAALNSIPMINKDGFYKVTNQSSEIYLGYNNAISGLMGSGNYGSVYNETERSIIQSSLELMNRFNELLPQYTSEYKTLEDHPSIHYTLTSTPRTSQISSSSDGIKYIHNADYNEFQKYITMLNGGTVSWTGTTTTNVYWEHEGWNYVGSLSSIFLQNSQNTVTCSQDRNVYSDIVLHRADGSSATARQILDSYNGSNGSYGNALSSIFNNKILTTRNAQKYLSSIGKTVDDIVNYQQFMQLKERYDAHCVGGVYQPDYEFIPSDPLKAAYYEEIYKAIEAAGGCKPVSDERAKNGLWVQNMIKSTQVMLTAWDPEKDMLSRTLSSLNLNIQEVSDQNYIERVSQEYEDTIATINSKDTKFDQRLRTLESEREAISTEIDSLKQVMKANIETNFKVFT